MGLSNLNNIILVKCHTLIWDNTVRLDIQHQIKEAQEDQPRRQDKRKKHLTQNDYFLETFLVLIQSKISDRELRTLKDVIHSYDVTQVDKLDSKTQDIDDLTMLNI